MSKDARARIAELEGQVIVAKIMARRFWAILSARVDLATRMLFADELYPDARRVIDLAFDAAEIVWERHRITVVPARIILDDQPEAYLARYPGGESRNISREQLLMMAGMDADQ